MYICLICGVISHSDCYYLFSVFEWVAFEVIALFSGLLPEAATAIGANAIVLQISTMIYMLYLGASIAVEGYLSSRQAMALGFETPALESCALDLWL